MALLQYCALELVERHQALAGLRVACEQLLRLLLLQLTFDRVQLGGSDALRRCCHGNLLRARLAKHRQRGSQPTASTDDDNRLAARKVLEARAERAHDENVLQRIL